MKIEDLKEILYNQHGCPFEMTVLWNFKEDKVNEYECAIHEYIINNYPNKEVKRIQAEIIKGQAVIVIQTD
jgi:hypothetical protein